MGSTRPLVAGIWGILNGLLKHEGDRPFRSLQNLMQPCESSASLLGLLQTIGTIHNNGSGYGLWCSAPLCDYTHSLARGAAEELDQEYRVAATPCLTNRQAVPRPNETNRRTPRPPRSEDRESTIKVEDAETTPRRRSVGRGSPSGRRQKDRRAGGRSSVELRPRRAPLAQHQQPWPRMLLQPPAPCVGSQWVWKGPPAAQNA